MSLKEYLAFAFAQQMHRTMHPIASARVDAERAPGYDFFDIGWCVMNIFLMLLVPNPFTLLGLIMFAPHDLATAYFIWHRDHDDDDGDGDHFAWVS